jgi:hypothetical protein
VAVLARFAASFRTQLHALRASLRDLPPGTDASRHAALLLHRLMFRRFLRDAGFEGAPPAGAADGDGFLDGYRWSLRDGPSEDALTPDVFGCLFDKHVSRKETGSYYTGRDVSEYIARATIVPAVLGAIAGRAPGFLRPGSVDDLVTQNVDLADFAAGAFARCDEPRALRAAWDALQEITVLDPTCGCGEFLVAALRVLETLYTACLERLRALPGGDPPAVLTGTQHHPTPRSLVRAAILRQNLYGLDVMPEAVEITRMRLLLMLAAVARPGRRPPWPDLGDRLRVGDVLAFPRPFPRVAGRGGFSVVLGNPPYIETGADGRLAGYRTASCGNLYAPVVERALGLLAPDGRLGMIVPHSAFCTDRMAPLLSLVTEGATTWVSTYDIRPCKLFAGVDQRLAIFLRHAAPQPRTYSTRYHRWAESERPHLFAGLRYLDVTGLRYENSIPKAGHPIDESVWHKIHRRPPLRDDLGGSAVVYYHNAPRYWVRALTFAPYFWNERDGEKLSAQVRPLAVRDVADAGAVAALLNSSLFCWWWLLLSDCRHLNRREIDRFPAGIAEMTRDRKQTLGALRRRLMADYRRHAVRKVCHYRATGRVVYDEFYPGRSKAILDEIDRVLAGHYGLTDEELGFIVNYDIKYRLGGD